MGRRRGRGVPPPKSFDAAWAGIDTLEANVIRRTVDTPYTPEQVVRWMFPDDVVDKLQAAWTCIREVDRTTHFSGDVNLPLMFPTVGVYWTIKCNSPQLHMCVPAKGRMNIDDSRGPLILESLRQVYTQHLQFEKVRAVVRWLNTYATVGAARHYCPWLTSVLPPDHDFQSASGTIYREPSAGMAGIMPAMRESGAIMAGALLCGNNDETPDRNLVQVQFKGQRDTEAYTSNAFGLL